LVLVLTPSGGGSSSSSSSSNTQWSDATTLTVSVV